MFKETIGPSDIPVITSYSHILDDQSPVIYVDFVPSVGSEGESEFPADIIVVHRDGTVRRVTGDLQETKWTSQSVSTASERALPPQIISAQWTSFADASTALLRKRHDILQEVAASRSSFLVLIYRDGDHQESDLRAAVFEVPAHLPQGPIGAHSNQPLRMLTSNRIPDSERWSSIQDIQIHFHASSARLSISSRDALINYDFSSYVPEIVSSLSLEQVHSSLFPLTDSLAAGALPAAVQIYNLKHQSIQARYGLDAPSRRRGRGLNARKAVRFISYFTKLDVLLVLRGRSLISFNVGRVRTQDGSSSRPPGLLIDSLGRNTYAAARITPHTAGGLKPGFVKQIFVSNLRGQDHWEAQQKILDALVQKSDVEGFERSISSELRGPTAAAEDHSSITNSPLVLPGDDQFVSFDRIHYLLSKMFRVSPGALNIGEEETQRGLIIDFLPPTLFQWLARTNHLGTFEVERALSNQTSQVRLERGAVARSIIQHDQSLRLLADYLEGANLLDLDEAVMVLKFLIIDAVANTQTTSPSEQLLLKDSISMPRDESMTDVEEAPTSESPFSGDASGWSNQCINAMNATLEKLQGFSPWKMTSAIRTHLSSEESLALIQFLRQQLFRSGHTSSFPNLARTSDSTVLPLEITASVLSSCIDALGPLGFVGACSDGGLWGNLVPDLKSEISLALGGLEEATYLRGVLQEMVRYCSGTECLARDSPTQLLGNADSRPGNIMTLYAESSHDVTGQDLHEPSSLLPLSLKAGMAVSRSKKRKGGGEVVERSARELQYLKSRNLGRYSFERLIL